MRSMNLPSDLVKQWEAQRPEVPTDPFFDALLEVQRQNLKPRKGLAPAPLHERLKMEALWG